MDPKTLPSLDPKLKEVYERVMGSSVPQPQPASPQTPNQPPTPPPPPPPSTQSPAQTNTNPVVPPPPQPPPAPQPPPPPIQKPLNNNGQELHATQVFNPHLNIGRPKIEASPAPSPVSAAKTVVVENKSQFKIGVPVLALVGVVFLIIYAFFWVNFFKIHLPF